MARRRLTDLERRIQSTPLTTEQSPAIIVVDMGEPTYSQSEYDVYLQERRNLVESEAAQASAFDKYLLTIAAGTFALTLTVMTSLFDTATLRHVPALVSGWALIAACILLVLLSFILSQFAYRRQVTIVEQEILHHKKNLRNVPSSLTLSLNIAAILSFVAGIVLMFIFVAGNLQEPPAEATTASYGLTRPTHPRS